MPTSVDQCSKFKRRRARLGLWVTLWMATAGSVAGGDGVDDAVPVAALGADPAKRAVAPLTPELPAGTMIALQGGDFNEAIKALDALIADAPTSVSDRAFYRLVRGTAARLANRPDDARATWLAAIDAEPRGIWANKLRGEFAALELATGHPDRAEVLARTEAEALLSPDRKDRLAGVYREFAQRLLRPPFPGAPGNPTAAYALLAQARAIAKENSLRATLLYAMGRAGQEALTTPAQPPDKQREEPVRGVQPAANLDPIRDYRDYLQEYPQGQDRDRVRFHLGEVQLLTGRAGDARLTWTDLARDLAREAGINPDQDRSTLRGQTLYEIARTYGMPSPRDKTSLNLGVAALRRFLSEVPGDPQAPRVAFEIGQAYWNQGQADPAIAAFTAFLKGDGYRVAGDEARRAREELGMRATFLIARATLGQGKFAEAVTALESYLNQFPSGPESGDARRAILDANFAAAQDAENRAQHAEARAGWLRFVAANPLEARVPAALFNVGLTFKAEKQWSEAIAAWDALAARFPGTNEAAQGQYAAAVLVETEQGDPAAAIERYRKVQGNAGWIEQARQRIAVMESKALTVVSPRTFRSGETSQLKVATRNLERLTFSAYKLNPEAYFRKKRTLDGVSTLDIGLVAPDAEWTVPVPNYGQYKPLEATFDLKVALPGVYVVKVTDEKTLQAAALVIGSDLEAIVKASRDQVLVFAQDMKTGRGRPGARVIAANEENLVFEGTTGADGVVQGTWNSETAGPGSANPGTAGGDRPPAPAPTAPAPPARLRYLVLDGADAAGSGLSIPNQVARGLSPRAYIDTDRPAYRPGQEVLIRGVIREVAASQYRNPSGQVYKLDVFDTQGRLLSSKDTTLSEFGTFRDSIQLAAGAPVGSYRIKVWQPGGSEFTGGFEIKAYRLAKLGLEFDLPRTVYYRGEVVKGTLQARYGYDAPASGRPIAIRLPDGQLIRGQTDAQGRFPVEFATDTYGEDQALAINAQLTADDVAARALVRVAVQGFAITLATPRPVYLDGETFTLNATTLDALGQPTGQELRVAVIKPVQQANAIVERQISVQTCRTDPVTGRGQVALRVEEAGSSDVILRVAGTDQFRNAIVADHRVTISGKNDADKLRILADRTDFKVGEAAIVRLVNRGQPGPALITWEADRILRYRLLDLTAGESPLRWEVDGAESPNLTLTANRMEAQRFDQARLDLKVERDLRITLKPKASSVPPGAEVEVEVTAVDQLDRPARAELALALVDRTLLRQFGDKLPPIGPFFADQTRLGSFATESTNTFTDHPITEAVPDAVVEESSREVARVRRDLSQKQYTEAENKASDLAGLFVPQESPAPAAPPGPGLGAVGGGGFAGGAGGIAGGAFGFGSTLYGMDTPGQTLGKSDKSKQDRRIRRYGDADYLTDLDQKLTDTTEDDSDSFAVGLRFSAPVGFRSPLANRRQLQYLANQAARQEFVETAYWNPVVVTGFDGKATIKFTAPEALSEYRLMAKGVTGADSLVGQSSINVAVRQNFYVELRTPARLTEGDQPRFLARVHHVGLKAGTVIQVRLSSYAAEQDRVDPKTVEVAGDGVAEILFDPIAIPDAESIRLTVAARAGDLTDEVKAEIPVQPWGVQALATASGTASNDATAFVALPAGRRYDDVAMRIELAPTLDRLVVALASSQGFVIDDVPAAGQKDIGWARRFAPLMLDTTADRASDLLAAVAALTYLRDVRSTIPGEATRLRDAARGLVAELIASQNGDGGWPWIASHSGGAAAPSERNSASAAAWALREASQAGIEVDSTVLTRAGDYLLGELGRTGGDLNARSAVLHALTSLGRANFEAANALNRGRQNLADAALAHLALSFGLLDRASLAGEVLDLLATRAKSAPVGPGAPPQTYWDGSPSGSWYRGRTDATALVALAFARVRPASPEFAPSVAWLLAHRSGVGWTPHKARGPAVAAVAALKGKGGEANDRYRLAVAVNDVEVARIDVTGARANTVVAVPRQALKVGAPNAVRFAIEGRGTFGYAVTLTGFARDFSPEQKGDGKPVTVSGRDYLPSAPELDGKALPTGFGSVVNPTKFVNKATQVTRGGRVEVDLRFQQEYRPGINSWDRDFLIVEETLPAGTTLVDGSLQTSASSFTLGDGTITLAFAPETGTPRLHYEVAGYLPGEYRALPTVLRNAYEPGLVHLGPVGSLRVLAPGEPATDPYRASPDELLARGKALAAHGRLAEAAVSLEELLGGFTPTDEVARDVARILLAAHIQSYDARKVVRDFEILKEKGPEVVIPFDEVLVVGRAYRDIAEPERAFLVFRALAEASYLEDAQVGGVLRQNGQTLEAITYLLDLWRESPGSASIEGDLFGLSQVLTDAAGRAINDPGLRDQLARANIAQPALLAQAIRLIRTVLSLNPRSPLADEASLALLSNELDLENYEAVTRLAPRFAALYPKSTFLDSFQYADALSRFQLGQYDRAIEVAAKIASATYPDPNGVPQPSPNKWQALYILGQIHDARRQPAQAVEFYKQVADRFSDAADAVLALNRRTLKLPEVTIVTPAQPPARSSGGIVLSYRNIGEVDLKVYSVDLMRLYLSRRNLDGIAGIDLAGITPLHEATIKLGEPMTYADATRTLDLPVTKEGAYLVMVRGGDLYASGIVLVSPIRMEVTEETDAGRVRVVVRDAASDHFVPKVQVKVIGSNNPTFTDGRTDLRGVAIAEGIRGQVTAVARLGTGQYAFYRGTEAIGLPQPGEQTPDRRSRSAPQPGGGATLEQNLKTLNIQNQNRGIDRLQNRFNEGRKGIQAQEAK